LDALEALSAVAFAFAGWLGAGDVSLDTLEVLFALASLDELETLFSVAFAFSGWLGSAVDAEKFELLFVELSTCVDVFVVAFGISLMFDAHEDCMKLRQMQRQSNR